VAQKKLNWQSKVVLLLTLPFAGAEVVLQAHGWAVYYAPVVIWALGLSMIFAVVVLKLRAATPVGALAGAVVAACMIFSTTTLIPGAAILYAPWRSALIPLLAVVVLTFAATRLGRKRKEILGVAERRHGRTEAQVAANLGVAAIAFSGFVQSSLFEGGRFHAPLILLAVPLAALAEAGSDTVSSEIGQALGGQPRMITTLHPVAPGTDGGISLIGTLAGVVAAAIIAAAGAWALSGGLKIFWVSAAGGVFGLFFDSLLGATLERRGWLNNDAVNFLSTTSAALFALGVLVIWTGF
jgi:uncharacterized protein (TIGR00297 family)